MTARVPRKVYESELERLQVGLARLQNRVRGCIALTPRELVSRRRYADYSRLVHEGR